MGNGGIAPLILNPGTKWRRVSSFISGERANDTHFRGGWVDPRAVLDAAAKRKTPASAGNPTPVVQPIAAPILPELRSAS
jgi:hypothetical protein